LSATLNFLGAGLDVYGVINDSGLVLTVTAAKNTTVPGVEFSLSDTYNITINQDRFTTETKFTFQFGLNLPNIEVWGVSLGSFDVSAVSFTDDLLLTATYNITEWQNDELDFFVGVDLDVLGFDIQEHLDLDASVSNIIQLPNAIESFIVDKVVDYLEAQLNPLEDFEKGFQALAGAFNVFGEDAINVLSEAGHVSTHPLVPSLFFISSPFFFPHLLRMHANVHCL
jgi:hypothetical protein